MTARDAIFQRRLDLEAIALRIIKVYELAMDCRIPRAEPTSLTAPCYRVMKACIVRNQHTTYIATKNRSTLIGRLYGPIRLGNRNYGFTHLYGRAARLSH